MYTPVSFTAYQAVRFIYEVGFNVRGLSVDSALLQCHKKQDWLRTFIGETYWCKNRGKFVYFE